MTETEAADLALSQQRQILALEDLYDTASAHLVAAVPDVAQHFGFREKSKQLGAKPRVVWVPGNEQGDMGKLVAARNPGRNPLPLATLLEFFHCQITGFDPQRANDERAQYHATRLLYDAWYRAIHLAAPGTFEITGQRWLTERTESRYGLSIIVTGAIQSMIPDQAEAQTLANTVKADITVEVLDLTEHQISPEPP